MNVTSAKMTAGLVITGSHRDSKVSGNARLGSISSVELASADDTKFDTGRTHSAIIVGTDYATYSETIGLVPTGAWVAGQPLIERVTCAGDVQAADDITVTVTSSHFSQQVIQVPVLGGETPAVYAAYIRAALAANGTIAAYYTISGTGAVINATAKPARTHVVNGVSYPVYRAADATFDIDLAANTTGITEVNSSVVQNATATSGVTVFDSDGKEVDGKALTPTNDPEVFYIEVSAESSGVELDMGAAIVNLPLAPMVTATRRLKNVLLTGSSVFNAGLVITGVGAAPNSSLVTLTVAGSSAA